MARDDGLGICGFARGFLVRGGSLSDRASLAKDPGGGNKGPPREIVEISSDEEEEEDDGSAPVARKRGGCDLVVERKGKSCGAGVGEEEDDCVVLDSDPYGAVAVKEEKGSAGIDGSFDEFQIVAEKGQCYCFVCDAPAPCNYWGKGFSTDDHCHGTDKEIRWNMLRQEFKCERLPASHSEKHHNVLYPPMEPHRQQDTHSQVSALQSDPSFLSGQTVRAPALIRDGRGRENGHTIRATRPLTPCRQESYQQKEDEEYTYEKANVYVGNLHYDIVSEDLVGLFEQAGFVECSEVMYNRRTGQSRGFGIVTMSTLKEAELAVELFDGFKMHGMRLTVQKAAQRVARAEAPPRQSESPFRLYVGNLPSQASDSWLKELFRKHGQVVEARVVSRWTSWGSPGFGFVKMATEEESYIAIEALDKHIMEGRPLLVEVERPRRVFY